MNNGTLHAEIVESHPQWIVLLAVGEGYEQQRLGEVLSLITPGKKKSESVIGVEGGVMVPKTWATVVQLEHSFNGNGNGWWVPGPRLTKWILEQLELRHERTDPFPLGLPDGCVPRDYQIDGARQIAHGGRFLLADEPGVGKTACTILGLAWRQHLGTSIFPALIIVPSWGVASGWAKEIAKWQPTWRTVEWKGSKRNELAGTADVYLTTYATARRDAADMKGPLLKLKAVTLVGDEIHALKNSESVQSKAVRRIAIRAKTFVGLSGTIITQDIRDLWPTLKAMDNLSWPSGKRCTDRYCIKGNPDYGEAIAGLDPMREPEFRNTLRGAFRRVAKADVLTQLPPKIYTVRRVRMPDDWRKAYDGMEQDMLAQLPDGQELPAMDVLSKMNALGRMASAAFDVDITEGPEVNEYTGELKKHYHVVLKLPSWKVDELLEIMDERRGCAPIVTFAPSRQLVMIAGQMAEKAGYRVGYYVGLGGDVTEKSRQKAFDDLDAGNLDLLCVTTKTGGTGLNLTAAGTAVFLQRPWDFSDATQSEDRCMKSGTPVLTPAGWVPIEEISIGDLVVTHTGESRPVTDTWSKFAKADRIMAEVGITGQETVICTADHRFLLKSGEWCEAGGLKPGDWLAVPGNNTVDELTRLAFEGTRIEDTYINAWGNEQVNGRLQHAPETINVTDDFLYALGYYAGDGFSSTGEDKGRFLSFSGNAGKKALAMNRCERWATSVNLRGKRRQAPESPGTEQRFYSGEWAYWFSKEFGKGARNKHLPNFTLRLNERQSQVVLDGLSASDGYSRPGKERCEYSTMSDRLAANVFQLATRAGYRPSLTKGSTGQHIVAFAGKPGPRTAGRVRSILLRYPGKTGTVRQERIFDLSVKSAETFTVGGVVVHNCHRLGSEIHSKGVEIIDIVTINSVDSRVRERLKIKGANLAEMVQDERVAREILGGL